MKHVATLTSLALCALLLVAPASAQTEISITPYAGYNTTAGYNVDFEEAEETTRHRPGAASLLDSGQRSPFHTGTQLI